MKAASLLILAGCIHLPHVDPAVRSRVAQGTAAVRIEVTCYVRDPFGSPRNDVSVFSGETTIGSGVVVSERHVITAAHVVACPAEPTIHVTLANGRRLRMVVDTTDDTADLARLQIASADRFRLYLPPPVIAAPFVNERLCNAVTEPTRQWNCGFVSRISNTHSADTETSSVSIHGNSGAGAYDDAGNLIGIVSTGSSSGIGAGVTALIKHSNILPTN